MIDVFVLILDFLAFFSIYLILSISLNLEYGYTGIPNFGKVLFFAGGAFTVGALASRIIAPLVGVNLAEIDFVKYNAFLGIKVTNFFAENPHIALLMFIALLALAMIVGAILGYLASYPAIRLREDYLGMVLVVSGELARIVGKNYDPLICGTFGVFVPDPFSWAGRLQSIIRVAVMLAIAYLAFLTVEKLSRSPYGRVLRAIRDNEVAADAYGKNIVKVRMQVLVIGSALAGLAGALYAFYMGTVHPDDYSPLKTFVVWIMVIMGGRGNNTGAAVGALIYLLVNRTISFIKHWLCAPFDVNYLSYLIFGAIIILILIYKPQGLIPEKPSETLDFRKYLKKTKS